MFPTDDTIVAISTAAGSAARAIVRLSGPGAVGIAAAVFRGDQALADAKGFSAMDGLVRLAGGGIELPARVYVFRSPRSYTRQDVVELHIPGAAAAAIALNEELTRAGARQAAAGEFTARAFFSGRLDLSAAEAVADVIDAASDAQLRSAMAALGGQVHRLCQENASAVAEVLAEVEASIDVADEDLPFEQPAAMAQKLAAVAERLDALAGQAESMPDSADRPHVVIAGRPNAGKSSLLNALAGADRAIVSALAGTTRDVLSASMTVGQTAVILQDVAGLGGGGDPLAVAAHAAARAAVARADAILFLFDLAAPSVRADIELLQEIEALTPRTPILLAANKIDLLSPQSLQRWMAELAARGCVDTINSCAEPLPQTTRRRTHTDKPAGPTATVPKRFRVQNLAPRAITCTPYPPAVAVSAARGTGLDELRAGLEKVLHLSAARSGAALGLHQRQKQCLANAAGCLRRTCGLLGGAAEISDVAELAAVELRGALAELGQISGQIVTEDILGRIFRRFCVGK